MLRTSGFHHITLVGSNEFDTIRFYQDILGMPLVIRQPNLDVPEESHLFFDMGDGRLITFFCNDNRESNPRPAMQSLGTVHHIAFSVSTKCFERAVTGLGQNHVPNSGRMDRGFMDSLYFHDHNGQLLELSVYKVQPPPGYTMPEVLATAQRLRAADGIGHIEERHMHQAVEELTGRSSAADSPG